MEENILTNYNLKFKKSQLDHEIISNTKCYYKIYNNKISEPLHKFWFSVPSLKYSNNYSDFKTIRFLMNNKNDNISNLIDYIKDIGNYLIEKFSLTFENLSVDYPWKESEQYPYIFSFFTNNTTLLVDNEGNELKYDTLNSDLTYSIIFEISNIRIMPIKMDTMQTNIIKINLVLLLIKQDEKKDLKKIILSSFVKNNSIDSNSNLNSNQEHISKLGFNSKKNIHNILPNQKLPFLNQISEGTSLLNSGKINIQLKSQSQTQPQSQSQSQSQPNGLVINTEQILKAINGLKKVEVKKENLNESENNNESSQINMDYLEQKNNLKKVKTKEKSLLKTLKKKNKKDKEKKKELELELELERELEKELL